MWAYEELLERYADIRKLGQINSVLMWDQNTYMPPGAVHMRGDQQALVSGLTHKKLTSEKTGSLLKEASSETKGDLEKEAVLREIGRYFDRATSVPESLVKEISRMEPIATEEWVKARQNSDFSIFKGTLEKMVSLKRQMADYIGYEASPYDALLDEYEPYMRADRIRSIFSDLREELIPIVSKLTEVCKDVDTSSVTMGYPIDLQEKFFTSILEKMGYDFQRGRMDVTAHPFTSGSMDDVRVTLRYDENDIRPGLFSAIHEGGHALYEQGFLKDKYNTPLAESISLGIHESQSRLWENIIGRSHGFWKHMYPELQRTFPSMKDETLAEFHRGINNVKPSLIRVEADEVTYSMHIIVRFETELDLIENKMDVDEIPSVWNEKYEKYLGITPPNDSMGCLQDIHWAMGAIGYFPTYSLGNLYSSQFYDAAVKEIDDLPGKIENGGLNTLLQWLRTNIHQKGRLLSAEDLVKEVTGKDLEIGSFVNYLKNKFNTVYNAGL